MQCTHVKLFRCIPVVGRREHKLLENSFFFLKSDVRFLTDVNEIWQDEGDWRSP